MARPKLPPEDPFSKVVRARFWGKVRKTPTCWWWTGAIGTHGYGFFHIRGLKNMTAHVYSYLAFKGPIPEGHQIRHTCDNRACVRPKHLITGTRKQNMQDAVERGRINPWLAGKTHCKNGHPWDEENTEYRTWVDSRGVERKARRCRTCRRAAYARWAVKR